MTRMVSGKATRTAAWTALFLGAVCSCSGEDGTGNEDIVTVPPRPAYNEWLKIEPPGAVCGNGSQYKFFVNFSETSNDLVVALEPGGACWDYPSCTGANGVRGAANINGIPDNHYELAPLVVPFFQREFPDNQTADWNYVYVPYCTGDVHTGNTVATYADPADPSKTIEFHHAGHTNVQAVIGWIAQEFPQIPRLMLSGCSAGGAGSLVNYHYVREGLPQVERAYLLSDSGPIFPSSGNSAQLHATVRQAWNLDELLDRLPVAFDRNDFGSINTLLAELYPEDRLTVTFFRRDYNYSLYSYERFFDFPPKEEILRLWWEDTQLLTALYDQHDNLAYYIPYWRRLNDSHCTTPITYEGAEIQEANMTLGKFIDLVLDDSQPLQSYLESVQPGEDVAE